MEFDLLSQTGLPDDPLVINTRNVLSVSIKTRVPIPAEPAQVIRFARYPMPFTVTSSAGMLRAVVFGRCL